ncbi:hypothetical protein GSI_07984 [Ganoderma sinense ZZ0214-1]|uniref:Uncharacterized protein n=1 Tax=Ganoderma sinense ZZ0214-1 TaxID=1077348 RepID=A0A2G8S7M4_9APHY|nr:hypothetical protein GSI_07984 [Ganoderma sinense ZZ0214-1]
MVPSTSTAEPSSLLPGAPFTRSDSVASSVHSGGLRRRSRTRTRSIALSKRGKSQEPSPVNRDSRLETGESFLDFDDAPPVPKVLYDEPEEMTVEQIRAVKKARRRSRTVGAESRPHNGGLLPEMARARSALDVRQPPFEQVRGRQAKSDNGSVKAAKLRGLSLPRQAVRQHSPSDESSQPSPLTPYGFGDATAVRFLTRSSNPRDSVMTQNSTASSSLYPASTSIGTRTESSMPYTDDQDESDLSYPEIVTPDHPEFNPDDVSNRLRLLLNNSYFLPPAHTKPTPFSLSPNPTEAAKKNKPANGGFFDFFRLGKSKSKPASPIPGSPPAVDGAGPILRTTSDMPSASGLLHRVQQQPLGSPTLPPPPPPASRVVVLRERMEDLATAAKEAEKELRSKDVGKIRSQTTPRDRFVDDIIDPTDAVDLPLQMADSMFAVQTSAAYGLGPQDSLNAAVLADRLVPGSPGLWSRSSEEDSWRKDLLHQAVSHSLGNTPDHSFSSSVSGNGGRTPVSPPPQSEASFPTPTMQGAQKARVGQRIVEDLSIRSIVSFDISPPVSPMGGQHVMVHARTPSSSGERSPPANEHPMLSAVGPPARAETPAHMPVPLAPAPRKQLVNPLYSLSQPDLPGSAGRHGDGLTRSSSDSYHTVPKATPSTGLSAAEEAAAEIVVSLSPPPLSRRGITPEPRGIEGMPSFTTTATRSRTESESRYSSDEMSFRTPLDTDAEVTGGRPSMTLSLPFGRPSISVSVSEFSIPSPTASAFGDAVFGSCRTPSVMSRRSISSHPSPSLHSLPELPPLPATPRSAISPPPRVSSSVSPTELPVPPRRRAPHLSPSSFDTRSLNSRSPLSSGSPAVLDIHPTQDALVDSSFSSVSPSASPTVPIAARRGLGSPLSLTIPTRIRPPVIHSAPAPASPTDFFDRIPTTIQNAMDDLDTSDESDSEDGLPSSAGDKSARSAQFKPPPRSSSLAKSQSSTARSESVETAEVFVEPRTQAISNRASSSSARPSIMRLGNHSTPQFSPASSLSASAHEPLPQYTYDRKKPIGNVVELGRRSFASSRSPFKKGKGIAHVLPTSPLLPIGAMPSSPIAPGTSFAQGQPPLSPRRRPATAPEEQGKGPGAGRKIQRESIQRFDGMLVQHLAAERDRMKRITSDYLSPSSAEGSPAHLYSERK